MYTCVLVVALIITVEAVEVAVADAGAVFFLVVDVEYFAIKVIAFVVVVSVVVVVVVVIVVVVFVVVVVICPFECRYVKRVSI